MHPPTHFLFAFLLGEVFVKFNLLSHELALIAGIIGLLIDLDHYIYYIIVHKNFSLKGAWNAAVVHHEHERTFIHHESGFLLVTIFILLLSIFRLDWFLVVAIGYYSHVFLDYAHLNIFNIRKIIKEKEGGFVIRYPLYELIFGILILLGLVLLLL
ncbi:hypothetical protein GOV14_03390 [Candidatus Pacearchaeota archaeon]|nr:hypothetical protein [Candidatus Pacearchaeota archaeon]